MPARELHARAGMILELAGLLTHERPLRTLWQLAPRGRPERRSVLIASAACLPWRFSGALRRHVAAARTVVMGGPLDPESIGRALRSGHCEPAASLSAALERGVRARLHRLLGVPVLPREAHELYRAALFGSQHEWLESELRGLRPWRAFLGLWSRYCSEKGASYQLDMDAARIAAGLGKPLAPLQSIEEQIAFLEAVPVERIVRFIAQADWEQHRSRYARSYAAGDCETLFAVGKEFPLNDEALIEERASVLAGRAVPHLAEGGACIVLGASHCGRVLERLREAGFEPSVSDPRLAPAP